jgi:hypothetical protein
VTHLAIRKANKSYINQLLTKLNGTHIAGLAPTLRIENRLIQNSVQTSIVLSVVQKD